MKPTLKLICRVHTARMYTVILHAVYSFINSKWREAQALNEEKNKTVSFVSPFLYTKTATVNRDTRPRLNIRPSPPHLHPSRNIGLRNTKQNKY